MCRLLVREIEEQGPLPFADYMSRCLYHPGHGYYARPDSLTVSKKGDFMTSVSVGPLFGNLLARRLHRFWLANHGPPSFTVLEPGAHDGSLALDVLDAARQIDPSFHQAIHYVVIEPLAGRRPLLEKRLGDRAAVLASPTECEAPFGALLANEVLDALPVPLFLKSGDGWHEVLVTTDGGGLAWDTRPAAPPFPGNLPEGYLTEGPPDFRSFLAPFVKSLKRGLFLWIDYGLDQASLLNPGRTAGTLRCFSRHSSKVHPLDRPGEQDLTADVNFTALEKAARDFGQEGHPAMNQSRYLTHLAREWLLKDPSSAGIRQFQTLTHPSQFGNRFHALEFTQGAVERAFP